MKLLNGILFNRNGCSQPVWEGNLTWSNEKKQQAFHHIGPIRFSKPSAGKLSPSANMDMGQAREQPRLCGNAKSHALCNNNTRLMQGEHAQSQPPAGVSVR
eukprot:349888-Pelagomonas_calceolata.AAC.3